MVSRRGNSSLLPRIWNGFGRSLSACEAPRASRRLDSRAGTHPVITEIPDVFAAANAFDGITYNKGQAVVRMLESYVGEDAFRDGVRRYIQKHAYRNAVSDDLSQPVNLEAAARFTEFLTALVRKAASDKDRPRWKRESFFRRFAR